MNAWPRMPVIYEINTAVWLREIGKKEGRPVTLGSVPASELEWLASRFDAVWLMGVWRRSPSARLADVERPELRNAYDRLLQDWSEEDVLGSPFAIYAYEVDPAWGGDEELAALRERLLTLGVRLVLDFVPNHLALDHPWITERPEWLVRGNLEDLHRAPKNYFTHGDAAQLAIFAHGRDPFFEGWPDTVQIDLRQPGARRALTADLLSIARRCDGVRCDMAMLVTNNIFVSTWGGRFDPPHAEFWPVAIAEVKAAFPDFLMLAEVYWEKERELLSQGFDYAYDKRLLDRLEQKDSVSLQTHLEADPAFQKRLIRLIETHDEERVIARLGPPCSRAAAVLAMTLPGARLLHDGQTQGRRLKIPVQLGRRPEELANPGIEQFYDALLLALRDPVFHDGEWRQLQPQPVASGHPTHEKLFAWLWTLGRGSRRKRRLVIVNYSPDPSSGSLVLDLPELAGDCCELTDCLSGTEVELEGDELRDRGFDVSLRGYESRLYELHLSSEIRRAALPVEGIPGFRTVLRLPRQEKQIYGLAWSPDGRKLALGLTSGAISIRDLETSSARRLKWHRREVSALAWSKEGTLASGSFDHNIALWDSERESIQRSLRGHRGSVLILAWSPDGRTLASGSFDRTVRLWRDGKPFKKPLEDHDGPVNGLAWSPDSKRLASGGGDATIRLWNADTGELLEAFKEVDWVGSLAWSPDGRTIAAGTGRGRIGLWDVVSGRRTILQGHQQRILCVDFNADGRRLASKSSDGTVRIWGVEEKVELASLEEAGEFLSGLAFHPSRSLLATRDDRSGAVRIWELDEPDGVPRPAKPQRPGTENGNQSGAGEVTLSKVNVVEPEQPAPGKERLLHLLHLSDLHLRTADEGRVYRSQLEADLKRELGISQLDYLVLSGDFADRGSLEGFAAAFELVDGLVRRFGLRSDRVIVVPGNHDVSWDHSARAYQYVPTHRLPKPLGDEFIAAGPAGALRRDEESYKQRFAPFDDHFYKKVYSGVGYPLDYERQALVVPSREHNILFLALNSAWQIDHYYTQRASIHPQALSVALDEIGEGYDDWLKIAAWHHPVSAMDPAFLERLVVAGFGIGMHGHIHEARNDRFFYETDRGLRVIGAGTFGAPANQQVTGIPLQYNLLRLDRENEVLTVETRKKEKPDGAWSADARWGKKDPKPRYEIRLGKP